MLNVRKNILHIYNTQTSTNLLRQPHSSYQNLIQMLLNCDWCMDEWEHFLFSNKPHPLQTSEKSKQPEHIYGIIQGT